MCGIVGVFGDLYAPHRSWFEQALEVDALRGRDSTGIAVIHKSGFADIAKYTLEPRDFLQMKPVEEMMRSFSTEIGWIGHNRSATRGSVSKKNAHPFHVDHIVLVHNGTLLSWHDLPDASKFTVDSEAIAHSIATIGVEETLVQLNGAFALVWYDLKAKTLNFIRNEERPLCIAKDQKNNAFLFASEPAMLWWLAQRNNIEVSNKIDMIPAGQLHVFDVETNKPTLSLRDVKLRPKTIYPTYTGHWDDEYEGVGVPDFFHGNGNVRNRRIPTQWQKEKIIKDKLKQMNITYGDKIQFHYTSWKEYNPRALMGRLTGIMCEEPYLEVRCHGTPKALGTQNIEVEKDRCYAFEGVLENAHFDEDVKDVVLILDTKTLELLEYEDDDEVSERVIETGSSIIHLPEKRDLKQIVQAALAPRETPAIMKPRIKARGEKRGGFDGSTVLYPVYNGQFVDGPTWETLTKGGCMQCTGNLSLDMANHMHWVDLKTPLCPDCTLKHDKIPCRLQ